MHNQSYACHPSFPDLQNKIIEILLQHDPLLALYPYTRCIMIVRLKAYLSYEAFLLLQIFMHTPLMIFMVSTETTASRVSVAVPHIDMKIRRILGVHRATQCSVDYKSTNYSILQAKEYTWSVYSTIL